MSKPLKGEVYKYYDEDGNLLYIGSTTVGVSTRWEEHIKDCDTWCLRVRKIMYAECDDCRDAEAYYTQKENPRWNINRMHPKKTYDLHFRTYEPFKGCCDIRMLWCAEPSILLRIVKLTEQRRIEQREKGKAKIYELYKTTDCVNDLLEYALEKMETEEEQWKTKRRLK